LLTQVKAARSLAHLASITADRYGDLYKQHVVSAQALDVSGGTKARINGEVIWG
jgi:multidrug resistance efflux pump